jgi:hypothetical protein
LKRTWAISQSTQVWIHFDAFQRVILNKLVNTSELQNGNTESTAAQRCCKGSIKHDAL